MKKRIFAMIMLSALALTACGNADEYTVQDTPPALGLAEVDGAPDIYNEGAELYNEVYLWTEQESYLPDTERITVTISNNTDEGFGTDAERFSLSRVWENGVQDEVPYKAGGDCFNELAMLVMPHDSATFIADIAAHYELPLAEGDYLIEIGGMQTGFSVSANAPAVIPEENLITIRTEFETYPAGITAFRLLIANDGDELFTCTEDAFGLEHFGDGFVSMTPFAGEPHGEIYAEPHGTGEWVIRISDFGETELPAGDYAICLNGMEARFTVSDAADENTADNSALPAIVFLGMKQYPEPAEARAEIVFVTREGTIYLGERMPLINLLAAYEAQTLSESFAQCGKVDAAELAAQYEQLTKAAETAQIEIVRPEVQCAIMAREYLWYSIVPDEEGSPALLQIGEVFHSSQYFTENETADAVCEWVMSQMDAWLKGTP